MLLRMNLKTGSVPETELWEGFKGHLVDVSGSSVDEKGNLVDGSGNRVDLEGNRIDENGYLLNDNGEHKLDDNGQYIMSTYLLRLLRIQTLR